VHLGHDGLRGEMVDATSASASGLASAGSGAPVQPSTVSRGTDDLGGDLGIDDKDS